MEIYVVEPGDSVDSIGAAFGVDPGQVVYDNQLVYPYALALGLSLIHI